MHKIKQSGFSLIELTVSLSIIAVLALSVAPSVNALIHESTATVTRAALMQDIRLLRSLARSRRTPSYLCATNDQNECVKQNDWTKGWLGFVDYNYNRQFDAGDELVVQYAASEARNIDVLLHTMNKNIMIDSTGTIRSSGHLRVCYRTSKEKQSLTLIRMNAHGRLSFDEANNMKCQ